MQDFRAKIQVKIIVIIITIIIINTWLIFVFAW